MGIYKQPTIYKSGLSFEDIEKINLWEEITDIIHFSTSYVSEDNTKLYINRFLKVLKVNASIKFKSGLPNGWTDIGTIDDLGITFDSGNIKMLSAGFSYGLISFAITNSRIMASSENYTPAYFTGCTPVMINFT